MRAAAAGPAAAYRTSPDIEGVAVTGTGTYRSAKTNIAGLLNASYILTWTGTPGGAFTVWASNKDLPPDDSDVGWIALSLATAITAPAGSAAGDYVDLTGLPFRWVRLKYINATGSGVIFADVAGK